jgi:hypothetical protein
MPDDIAIYELKESDGTIALLGNYKGIPEDENFLNNSIMDINDSFDKLREIEK